MDTSQLAAQLSEPILQGWAIAVPIITSAISGMMQARANKKAVSPMSDQAMQGAADKYFPGLFSQKGAWNPNAMVNPIQTRATGGPVAPGTPYLVGEKGPEVITPTQPGMVTPNPATASMTQTPTPPPTSTPTPAPSPTPTPTPAPTMTPGASAASPASAAPMAQSTTTATPPGPGPSIPGNMNPVAPPAPPTGNQVGGANVGLPPGVGITPKAQEMAAPPTSVPPAPTSSTGSQTAGGLAVQQMVNQLSNPGQISPAGYERKQEQAMQGYNLAMRSIGGGLSSVGINPNSGYGLMMGQSAALNAMKLRNEANRDFTMASEQLKREDIKSATDNYLKFLETIFGLGAKRMAGNLSLDTMGPARSMGMLGQTLGDYFKNKEAGTVGAPSAGPGNNVGPDDLN